jgi:hypothetical protein
LPLRESRCERGPVEGGEGEGIGAGGEGVGVDGEDAGASGGEQGGGAVVSGEKGGGQVGGSGAGEGIEALAVLRARRAAGVIGGECAGEGVEGGLRLTGLFEPAGPFAAGFGGRVAFPAEAGGLDGLGEAVEMAEGAGAEQVGARELGIEFEGAAAETGAGLSVAGGEAVEQGGQFAGQKGGVIQGASGRFRVFAVEQGAGDELEEAGIARAVVERPGAVDQQAAAVVQVHGGLREDPLDLVAPEDSGKAER